jgi:transcriptional regulator with XRE-family HTH domain
MNIGENIKKYRKEKKLTQKELADKSKVSEISIRKYESGDRNPKIEAVTKIATALEVAAYELHDNSLNSPSLFSERLKELRESLNLTQTDLSDRLNKFGIRISPQGISYWEKGREPSFVTLIVLSSIFNVSVDYLIGKTNYKNEESKNIDESIGAILDTPDKEKAIQYMLIKLKCFNDLDVNNQSNDMYKLLCKTIDNNIVATVSSFNDEIPEE